MNLSLHYFSFTLCVECQEAVGRDRHKHHMLEIQITSFFYSLQNPVHAIINCKYGYFLV